VQLGVEDREPQPVVGEAVLWRAVPAQDIGPPPAWPACRCTCSYPLCSDWRSQAIVPLNSDFDSRVERTGDGARFKRAYTRPATNAAAWSVSPGTYS
jgi:hypothetical protein